MRLSTTTPIMSAANGSPHVSSSYVSTVFTSPSATPACVTYAIHATLVWLGGQIAACEPADAPTYSDKSRTCAKPQLAPERVRPISIA